MEISASKAYLGDNYRNLYILEVANPAAPYVIEHLELNGTPNSIVVGPDLVYMTPTANTLNIMPAQCDASLLPTPVLGAVSPSSAMKSNLRQPRMCGMCGMCRMRRMRPAATRWHWRQTRSTP